MPTDLSLAEMDEAMIEMWNKKVGVNDVVFHLGDFSFSNNPKKYVDRLNGNIMLVLGNHDNRGMLTGLFPVVTQKYCNVINDQYIVMTHCAHRVWEKSHYNSWHLYGHSHGRLPAYGKSFDVGVDSHGYKPLHFDEVKAMMNNLPDNWDVGIKDGKR